MTPITRRAAFTSAGLAVLGASLAASSRAAEASVARVDSLNVRSFGAKSDGRSDDTAASLKPALQRLTQAKTPPLYARQIRYAAEFAFKAVSQP